MGPIRACGALTIINSAVRERGCGEGRKGKEGGRREGKGVQKSSQGVV